MGAVLQDGFGYTLVPPKRHLSGDGLSRSAGVGLLAFIYAADLQGNIVELQTRR